MTLKEADNLALLVVESKMKELQAVLSDDTLCNQNFAGYTKVRDDLNEAVKRLFEWRDARITIERRAAERVADAPKKGGAR